MPGGRVSAVALAGGAVRTVERNDHPSYRDPRRAGRIDEPAVLLDQGQLRGAEVVGVLTGHNIAAEQVEPVLPGPAHRAATAAAVPEPVDQPGIVRPQPGPLGIAGGVDHRIRSAEIVAAQIVDQSFDPPVRQIVGAPVTPSKTRLPISSACGGVPALKPGCNRPRDSTSAIDRSSASRNGLS